MKLRAERVRADLKCSNEEYKCLDVLDEKVAITLIATCLEETQHGTKRKESVHVKKVSCYFSLFRVLFIFLQIEGCITGYSEAGYTQTS